MYYARRWIVVIVLGLLGTFHALAGASPQETPEALVRRVSIDVLAAARADPEIRRGDRAHIAALVESRILPYVDFSRMTELAAGRYWREATPEQRERLTTEFRELLVHTYSGALAQAGDHAVDVKTSRPGNDVNEAEVRVDIQAARGGEPIRLDYRMTAGPNGWQVYDIGVLGVSLVQTYRGNFATQIERGGINGLIATLSVRNHHFAAGTRE